MTPSEPRRRALVVEDDEAVRRLVATILRRERFEVVEAGDGHEAIEFLSADPTFVLIVLDLMMRRVSGAEVIEYLRKHFPVNLRRVVLITAGRARASRSVSGRGLRSAAEAVRSRRVYRRHPRMRGVRRWETGAAGDALAARAVLIGSGVSGTKQRRVLIAEDEPPIRRLLATALRRHGLDVSVARDGSEAQRMLDEGSWAVLLLDLMMPKLSGWELVRWLGEHEGKRPRSIIVMTAADRDVLRTLDPSSVNAIVFKPFDLDELAAYVRATANHAGPDRRRARKVG